MNEKDLRIDLAGNNEQENSRMVSAAYQILNAHPHFRQRCDLIKVAVKQSRIVLSGRLPTFYLKQLAQESLKNIGLPLVNQIDVPEIHASVPGKPR